jgi:lambda family phage portal protein
MAKILDRMLAAVGLAPSTQVVVREDTARHRRGLRGMRSAYEAAQISRLTSTWGTQNLGINQDLRLDLPILRARSRLLAANNDYMAHFLNKCRTNIVGPAGFELLWQPLQDDGQIDVLDADALAESFLEWCQVGNCDTTGQLSFRDVCNLWVTSWARDGEFLAREVMTPAANKWGYAIQCLDIDRLAHNRNQELDNGAVIKMGVEITSVGKPVAYHLYKKHPGENTFATFREGTFERVTADQVIHRYIAERPEQVRGIPWAHSALKRLWDLGEFEEAAIVAARIGAAQSPWIETPDGGGEDLADDKDDDGTLYMEAEPGVAKTLPPGAKLSSGWNPKFPDALYGPFVKAMLRGVASGLGTSYNSLANDLEGVNYSSIRQGVLDERDRWMDLQQCLVDGTLIRVANNWLRMALVTGAVKTKQGKPLPMSKFDKFKAHTWQGRRWGWVDPKADIQAATEAIALRVSSRTRICAQSGVSFADVLADLQHEEKQLKAAGLTPPPDPAANGKPGQQGADAEGSAGSDGSSDGSSSKPKGKKTTD